MRRKKVRLDLTVGSSVKHRTGTACAIAAQPIVSDKWVTIAARVMPSRVALLLIVPGFPVVSLGGWKRWSTVGWCC